ncbi:hypothetical protein BSKO_12219 [Bryopsis sp. KO-2023]|nr:hypothetical protein BSKO_12219 [Bryopsis sp. KO-2023]
MQLFGSFLLGVLFFQVAAVDKQDTEEALIGWQGETHDPRVAFRSQEISAKLPPVGLNCEKSGAGCGKASAVNPEWGRPLSWKPKVFHYPNFLSSSECDHIIRSAIPTLQKSVVYDSDGKLVLDDIRTSYGAFLRRLQDPIIRNVTSRVALVTHTPVSHQEDLQVLRYQQHQYYRAHSDTSSKIESPRRSTMLLYLSDVEEGGETAFPKTLVDNTEWEEEHGRLSDCAKDHIAIKPKKGDAMLFYSLDDEGEFDEMSRHMGCPVEKGIKWTATVWSHTIPWRLHYFHIPTEDEMEEDPGVCEDLHEKCQIWANTNECESNAEYMVGDGGDNKGHCRKSCKACEVCSPEDRECYKKNRAQAGYLTLDEIFEMDTWRKYQEEIKRP